MIWGYDWVLAFRPAVWLLLHGQSPYVGTPEPFVNAPWALLPLIPFALLPEPYGLFTLGAVSLIAFWFIAVRLRARPIALTAFLLSPLILRCIWMGQIDWIPLLGIVLPPRVGLFFVATKPQTAGFLAVYWLHEAWKAHAIIKTFAPVTILTLLSFVVFGFWPAHASTFEFTNGAWPWTIAISVAMLYVAYLSKNSIFAVAASPFAFPYARPPSFAGMLLPLLNHSALMVIACAAMWLVEVLK